MSTTAEDGEAQTEHYEFSVSIDGLHQRQMQEQGLDRRCEDDCRCDDDADCKRKPLRVETNSHIIPGAARAIPMTPRYAVE
jgi:hypothetical protein